MPGKLCGKIAGELAVQEVDLPYLLIILPPASMNYLQSGYD